MAKSFKKPDSNSKLFQFVLTRPEPIEGAKSNGQNHSKHLTNIPQSEFRPPQSPTFPHSSIPDPLLPEFEA